MKTLHGKMQVITYGCCCHYKEAPKLKAAKFCPVHVFENEGEIAEAQAPTVTTIRRCLYKLFLTRILDHRVSEITPSERGEDERGSGANRANCGIGDVLYRR